MENKKVFKVEIGGLSFHLKSSHDEEMIRQMVAYVDEKFQEARRSIKTGSFHTATILATLNIAEELFLLRKSATCDLQQIEDQAQNVLKTLESSSLPQPQQNHDSLKNLTDF